MIASAMRARPAAVERSSESGVRWARLRWALVVAVPFLFYLVPFVAGYGWSAINPMTPRYPGMPGSPDRMPAVTTAVEHYGTGAGVVPFQARLRAYLRDGELPLWNPYSGLGQPFAAQGEGGPYFPLAILRSLLPTSWSNAVTFLMIALSSVALFGFLRLLGLGPATAAFGGAVWALSGPFTLNMARNNLVDQFAMIPPLFLAAAWAVRTRSGLAYVAFAVCVSLHALAGFLQIGINALLLLVGFLLVFSYLRTTSYRGWLTTVLVACLFLGLGTALAGPYVLPIVEGVRAAYSKNVPFLAFLPMPAANVAAFFSPLLFGQLFESWLRGRPSDIVDWNNLYAHGSTGLLLLAVIALGALSRVRREQRASYLFFLGGLVFFMTRFVSLPPGSVVSYLPILSQQSPKHNQGPAVFCLVVAASFGVEWLRLVAWRRAVGLIVLAALTMAAGLGWLVWRQGGLPSVDGRLAAIHLGLTALVLLGLVAALWLACRAETDRQAALIATAAAVGESSLYLLLGNGELSILGLRLGIGVLVGLAGVLVARRALVPAAVAGLLALGAYAWVIVWPAAGLPRRVDVDAPPTYMRWLHDAAGSEYRAFGIYPDYSSVGEIQDTEVVGPLATNEWVAFVDLVGSPIEAQLHRIGSTFALTHLYDLTVDYPRARPLFDWIGVRYIVLDKASFDGQHRSDHLPLLDPSSGLRVAYDDAFVTILESPTAQSRAFFTTRVREGSAASTLARLHADPRTIADPVTVDADLRGLARNDGAGPDLAVPLAESRPNDVRATFDAPAPGLFVVKDSPFPGWQATLNGQPAEIVPVDGLVRGVVVPEAGHYDLAMRYRPASFIDGARVAGAALALLLALTAWDLKRTAWLRLGLRRATPKVVAVEPASAASQAGS